VSLYPTKTRLALLRAVDQADVIEGITDDTDGDTWLLLPPPDEPRRVTARVLEAQQAGWATLHADGVTWRLTDAGRTVLAGAHGVPC
jgi:hypothetical protein